MIKRLLLTLVFILTLTSVQAKVVEQTQTAANLNLKYPLVYVDDATAQQKINQDIAYYVDKMRELYFNKKMYQVSQHYKVSYEDNDVVSIIITSSWYNGRAIHGYHTKQGLVYNKYTGERIPAYNYVKIKSDEQLKELVYSGVIEVYAENGEKQIYPSQMFGLKDIKVKNENYALLGDGHIMMLYQPYELSAYANGVNLLLLDSPKIEYLNRLNS